MSINPQYLQVNPPDGPTREQGQTPTDTFCMTQVRRTRTFLRIAEPHIDEPQFGRSLRNDIHVGYSEPKPGVRRFFVTNLMTSDLGGGLSLDIERNQNGSELYTYKYVNTRTHRESQLTLVTKSLHGHIDNGSPAPDAWENDKNEVEYTFYINSKPPQVVTYDGRQFKIGTSPNATWDIIDGKPQQVDPKKLFLYLSGIFNRTVIVPYYKKHGLDIRGDRVEQNKLRQVIHNLRRGLVHK